MNVLVIGAYSSETLLVCGGTLAKCSRAGHTVALLTLCQMGTRHPECTPELIEAEGAHFRNAAALIGARIYQIASPQFDIRPDAETKLGVTEVIRQAQPNLIVTHDPDDYARDHRATAEIATESMFMSQQPGIRTASPSITVYPDLIFMDTFAGLAFAPEQYVDITEVIDLKRRMVAAYEDVVEDFQGDPVFETLELMEVTARYRGIQSGYRYAEAFRWPHRWGFRPGAPMLI